MNENKLIKLGVAGVVIVGIGVIGGFKFFEKIDNGYVGVRYSMNGGIKDEALTQGVKFVGIDKVIQYPIRLQTIQSKNISVSTSDGKKTTIDIKYDYKVDSTKAAKMYKEFGNITSEDIESGWLKSKLQKVAREVYAKYIGANTLSIVDILQSARWFDNLEEANQVSRRLGGLTQVYELVTIDHEEVE